jgi:hypothetical protein
MSIRTLRAHNMDDVIDSAARLQYSTNFPRKGVPAFEGGTPSKDGGSLNVIQYGSAKGLPCGMPSCQTCHGAKRRFPVTDLPRLKFHLRSIAMNALISVPLLALGARATFETCDVCRT